ncbi:adenylate-forming reductase 06235-like [Neltuma alba]|uniref:adenylate-forming reductase 06235-like n=1 Tax=Neltuma alba TaxID=207710 RepID=UPI0010A443E3|nr:adenylate-forming reductase 06235-like [Prosopis alba]
MEGTEMMKLARFSSCRGVAFEINPNRTNPFAIMGLPGPAPPRPPSPTQDRIGANLTWLPWSRNSSFKIVPRSHYSVSPSRSRASSHFCDIEMDEADDEVEVELIAEVVDVGTPEKVKIAPPKNEKMSRLSVILLDQGFTAYKILFLVCLSWNMVALALAASGYFQYGRDRATFFSIANIWALTLCRSEASLRLIFWFVVKTLGRPSVPLKVKTLITSLLQSVGGIHSGCGVSSIAWLVYSLVLTIKNKEQTSPEIIGLAFAILTLISLSSLVWLFIILFMSYEPSSKTYNVSISVFIKRQEFWFTIAITILIIIPWLTVRKVQVKVSAASSHASVIKFEGGVKPGLLGRISPSPLSEWHAFGIISDGENEHIMLAGAVGDYTTSLISNPPSHLWVRTMHFAGLPYLINLYQRVVLVATGSGICVFLSFLLQPCPASMFLVYSKEKMIVHDTAISGRPNVGEMSVNAAIRWDAEVVIVTSNPEGSRDVVRACKKARIPAFGPIWDS